MKNPIESPFTDGKIRGMSGAMPTSKGKGVTAKSSPSGKASSTKANMASKSGMSGK